MIEGFRKFLNMDKRFIYLAMAFAIAVPMFIPFGLPARVPNSTRDFYDELASLKENDIVWVAAELGPSQTAEFQPVVLALFRQCLEQKLRIVVSSFSAQGPNLSMTWAAPVLEEFQAEYGEDYVNIGPRPSSALSSLMDNARRDLIDAYSDRDAYGDRLSTMPIMAGLTKASDITMAVIFTGGSPGCAEYIQYWQTTGDLMRMITVASAVQIPVENVRYQAGMLQGMIGGMTGAAGYEQLNGLKGKATSGLDSQGLGHLVIVLLMVLGNICYFAIKNHDSRQRLS